MSDTNYTGLYLVSNKILLKWLDSKYTQKFITSVYMYMFIYSSEQKSSIICSIYQAYNKLCKVRSKNISNTVASVSKLANIYINKWSIELINELEVINKHQ